MSSKTFSDTPGIGRLGINPDAFGVWTPADGALVPWPAFLDCAADIGYAGVELGPFGYLPTDPIELTEELAGRGLMLLCGYSGGLFHRAEHHDRTLDQLRKVAGLTRAAGGPVLMLLAGTEWGPEGRVRLDAEAWAAMVDGLNEARAIASDEFGLETVYHPHVGMAVETAEETTRLLEHTDGELPVVLDTGQFAYTGADPVAFIEQNSSSVAYVHLRDLDTAVRDRCVLEGSDFRAAAESAVFCEPGRGSVDFSAVHVALERAAFDGPLVVERSLLGHDLDDAAAAAARAYDYHRAVGFG